MPCAAYIAIYTKMNWRCCSVLPAAANRRHSTFSADSTCQRVPGWPTSLSSVKQLLKSRVKETLFHVEWLREIYFFSFG